MDNSFFAYLQQLELFIFFSGYPLLYLLINSLGSVKFIPANPIKKITQLLPYTYALAGILFLGFEIKNLYPDFSIENISARMQHPFLTGWSLLSLIFWIPFFSKRLVFSFLHSLVVFIVFMKEMIQAKTTMNNDDARLMNDMRVYTISILLYLAMMLIFYFLSFAKDYFFSKRTH